MKSKEAVADTTADRIKSRTKGIEETEGKKAVQRDKRAQSLAAMGLVMREGSRYFVKSAAARGQDESYEVWRDENGRVRCSCAGFERLWADDPAFRCEHILAVKHSLAANNNEKRLGAQASLPAGLGKEPTEGITQARMPALPGLSEEDHEMNDKEKEIAQAARINTKAESGPQPIDAALSEPHQSAQIVSLAFANLLRTLRQSLDPRLIKSREGWTDRQGNTHWVEYIEWHTVADILDRVTPDWSHAVRNITQIGDLVAVTASITIDGVTREGVGAGPADTETGIKKAEHDALKRAAVKFGIARDLYRRESDVIEENGGIAPSIARDPRPKTLGDLVTPKQLWMIRNLGREIGCNVEQECQSLMQCNLEEISKRAASSFIDYLKRLQQENQPEELRQAS